VDRFVQAMPGYAMATAAYAVLDPASGVLRLANAGHLPPIIVGNGESRLLEIPPAAPLGAFAYGRCQEHETALAGGETLVFYTDGLVELPGVPLGESIDALLEIVRSASSAEEVCRFAIDQLVPHEELRDDVAIVAMQCREVPVKLSLRLAAHPRVLVNMRHAMRRWLREQGANGQAIAEITLAVNEACTNAIEHAYSPGPAEFEVEASADDRHVTISVRDVGRWRAPRGRHRGRGLAIIEAAMEEVEINSGAAGSEIVMRRQI
jgi:anti-sigma regulatory factor (Ser/Thr protein kinase)